MQTDLSCAYLAASDPTVTYFGAIVIGSGISGGWAVKELCEQGVKTLVLERGRPIEHIKDYPTATMNPWEFNHRGALPKAFLDQNPLISRAAGYGADTAHFFVNDADHPYVQEQPFDRSGGPVDPGLSGWRQVDYLGPGLPEME